MQQNFVFPIVKNDRLNIWKNVSFDCSGNNWTKPHIPLIKYLKLVTIQPDTSIIYESVRRMHWY